MTCRDTCTEGTNPNVRILFRTATFDGDKWVVHSGLLGWKALCFVFLDSDLGLAFADGDGWELKWKERMSALWEIETAWIVHGFAALGIAVLPKNSDAMDLSRDGLSALWHGSRSSTLRVALLRFVPRTRLCSNRARTHSAVFRRVRNYIGNKVKILYKTIILPTGSTGANTAN